MKLYISQYFLKCVPLTTLCENFSFFHLLKSLQHSYQFLSKLGLYTIFQVFSTMKPTVYGKHIFRV